MGPPGSPPLCSFSHPALVWGSFGVPVSNRNALGAMWHLSGVSRPGLKGSWARPGGPDFACEALTHLCLRATPRDRPRHRPSPPVRGEPWSHPLALPGRRGQRGVLAAEQLGEGHSRHTPSSA